MNTYIKKVMNKFTATMLFTLVFLVSFMNMSIHTGAEDGDTTQLRIVHTNDIHAQIEDFGKLAHYNDTMREQSDIFLYLDGGDISSGNPAVDIPDGKPIVDLLNRVGLDAMGVGNHEFDYGVEAFNKNYADANFDWLSANMEVVDSDIVQPEPYKIFEEDGVKIGVISLTQAPPATAPKNVEGIEFHQYKETIAQYTDLRDEVDVLLGLNHIGLGADRDLAEEFGMFDAIIGGHSHTKLNEASIINDVPVLQTGSHLEWIGNLTLEIDNDSKEVTFAGWEIDSVEGMTGIDEDVQDKVDEYLAAVEEEMEVEIGETTGLSSSGKNARDVPLGNFWTDAMRVELDADMAFTNGGGIRESIEAGTLTVGDIFNVEPFGNEVMLIEMTGEAIKDVIHYSYTRDYRNQIDLQTSGLNYTIITDSNSYYVDAELMLNDEPLDMDETYLVSAPDYIGSGGSGYNFEGEVISAKSGLMTELMIDYAERVMEEEGMIDYETEGRINVEAGEGTAPTEPAITVAEAIENNDGEATVAGYIVGHVVSGTNFNHEAPFSNDHNLLLADDPNEDDPSKMLPVQIPQGEIRDEFGLETNPEVLGKQVKVAGDLEDYYSMPGLKNIDLMEKIETIPVEDVRDQDEGTEVTVEGTVINVPGAWGGSSFYLYDESGGIQVFDYDLDVDLGDYIRLTGTLEEFNDEIQLGDVEIEVLETDQELPDPSEITIDEISEDILGDLVSLKGVTISDVEEQDFGTFEFTADLDGKSVVVRVDNRTGLSLDSFAFEDGDVIDVTGLVGIYDGTLQLKPRFEEDIVEFVEEPEEPETPEEPEVVTWLAGEGEPADNVGEEGNLYLDTASGAIYLKSAAGWDEIGNINNSDGEDGEPGESGDSWIVDEGKPTDEIGKEGDLYLDQDTGDFYVKGEDGWDLEGTLEGPAGEDGTTPDNDNDKGSAVGDNGDQAGGDKLPATATNMWSLMAIGGSLLLLGGGAYFWHRRRQVRLQE